MQLLKSKAGYNQSICLHKAKLELVELLKETNVQEKSR